MSVWICSLGDVSARLEYPQPLDHGSEDDLIEWLDLVISILKKRRAKLRAADPPVPQP